MREPYGMAIYCDDIRQEVGGKTTLVGIYGADMIVQGDKPVQIPMLAIALHIFIPSDFHYETAKVVVSEKEGDVVTPIFEMEVPTGPFSNGESDKDFMIKTTFSMSPFFAKPNSQIRTRAYLDELEVKMGGLKIIGADVTTQP